jgi:hypothetical protein
MYIDIKTHYMFGQKTSREETTSEAQIQHKIIKIIETFVNG